MNEATHGPGSGPRALRRVAGRVLRLFRSKPAQWGILPFRLILNNLLIATGLDGAYVRWRHEWRARSYWTGRSLRENVGFSHRPDVDEALKRVHGRLRECLTEHVAPQSRILDIGSGTGLVAGQFADRWKVVGLDISQALTEVARREVPHAEFHVGDITDGARIGPFAAAYSIGVLCYIPPGRLGAFFGSVADLLDENGLFYLQYPCAISPLDAWNPNLLYTKYSPRVVERKASERFETVAHEHSFFPGRRFDRYDPDPFPLDSFVNGYVYVGRRRPAR